jgi:adenosylmethionine-8-amino-7-oxononanoate aminotransferase
MSPAPSASTALPATPGELRRSAQDHLWLHFSERAEFEQRPLPVIARGEGCYLEDVDGTRYLDALAGLFAVQIGYSHGEEIGEAAAAQLRELPYYTNWNAAHPRAIELAETVAGLAPDGIEHVFFTSGGAEAVESAWKIAREYHALRGERRWKAIGRDVAYHGTSLGALSITGLPDLRTPFEPLVPQVGHVRNTNRFRRPAGETEEQFTAFLLDDLEHRIESEGPDTVAMVILEPVQNAGGAFTPPAGYFAGVRELCDRYGILLCADEVITGFGRLGDWFGSSRYDIRPDLITSAKGLSSAYASIGALLIGQRVAEPFTRPGASFTHGITFGGHPVAAAIALKNIEILRRERIVEHVAEQQDAFRATLAPLLDLPIVGDLRGTGFFYALELVKDSATNATFSDEESHALLHEFLSGRLFEAGLICRADDRGEPVVQISPPLIAEQQQFDEIAGTLRTVLTEAADRLA